MVFYCAFFCILLSSCKNTIYYSEIKEGNVNIPISTLGVDFVLSLDSIPKYDVNTILPAPLKEGIEHKIVTDIQGKLMALGFMAEDKPTSYYGSSTTDAIKSFERQLGFEQDGICNLELYKILMSNNAPSYIAMRHYNGEDIRLLQQQLYELCYLTDATNVNAYFGVVYRESGNKYLQLSEKTDSDIYFVDVDATGEMQPKEFKITVSGIDLKVVIDLDGTATSKYNTILKFNKVYFKVMTEHFNHSVLYTFVVYSFFCLIFV